MNIEKVCGSKLNEAEVRRGERKYKKKNRRNRSLWLPSPKSIRSKICPASESVLQ
jgi:hypothetical protein